MLRPRDNYSRVEVRAINYYNLRSDPKLSHRPCHVFNRPAGRKNPVETIRNYPTAPSMVLVVLDVEIIPSKLSGQILDTDVTSGALPIHACRHGEGSSGFCMVYMCIDFFRSRFRSRAASVDTKGTPREGTVRPRGRQGEASGGHGAAKEVHHRGFSAWGPQANRK